MSIFRPEELQCPACNARNSVDVLYSISADQRPDLRQAILDETLQRIDCGACKAPVRLEPRLTYLDVARRQWIVAWPTDDRAQWRARVLAAEKMHDRAYGPRAGRIARELGAGLDGRVVFGWDALREKLLIRALGLDDRAVELGKLALMWAGTATVGGTPLRVRAQDGERLLLSDGRAVPAALFRDIQHQEAPWAALRELLSESLYVDVVRLMATEPTRAGAQHG